MKNLAIFVSGRGTNMTAIIEAAHTGKISANISVVICNDPQAKAIEIARSHNLKVEIIDHKDFANRAEFDNEILSRLKNHNVDLICLAGFMRLLTADFLNKLEIPIINIHPSLLPKFKGANAVADAFNAGEKVTGCTVHYVIPEMDAGEIILQRQIPINPDDDIDSLKARLLVEEHIAYIEAINSLAN